MTLYRWLLRLFPPDFRARFGDDMTDVFTDRLKAARPLGPMAVATLWLRTIVDVVQQSRAERRSSRGPRSRRRAIAAFATAVRGDLLSAVKIHRRRPGFVVIAALMLAVGLGFNTALFAVVHAVILRPLPYAQPERIAMLWTGRNPDGSGGVDSYRDYLDWKERSRAFENLAIFNISFATLTDGGDPEEVGGSVVSPEFFHVLGARILLGRGIEAGDETIKPEEGRPIVIAHSLWTRRFNADPNILQRVITLAGRPRRVVGVVSPEFVHPEPFWNERAEYWSPLIVTDDMRVNRNMHFLRVIGRTAAGASLSQARAEMDTIGRSLMTASPATNHESVVVAPIADELIGDTRPLSWLFLGAALLVLSLVMANVINLQLARASRRRAELTIRTALGASRARLMSQLILESILVGLAGGLLGLAFAHAGIGVLLRYAPVSAPGLETTAVDVTVAGFALALSVLVGALCGVAPALRVSRARLSGALTHARGSSGLEASRARMWLVAAEMALAMPLLVGAVLLTTTLIRVQAVDPGFDPNHALKFRISLGGSSYGDASQRIDFFKRLEASLAAAPGVRAAGIVSSLPLGGLNNTGGSIVFEQPDGSIGQLGVGFRVATAGYFPALGVPVKTGRLFTSSAADQAAVVINERAAALMWGASGAIGRRLRFGEAGDKDNKSPWLTVTGVVGSLRHDALVREPEPEIFQPYHANAWGTMTVVAGSATDPALLAPEARAIVRGLDARLAVVGLGPVRDFLDRQLARPRFGVLCSLIFGGLGLSLAAVGAFAVLSLLVAQRTREIGIRMALGAAPRRVGALLLRQSLLPSIAGCVAGCLAAAALARALRSLLFGVTAGTPWAFALAAAALLTVAALACWWPARRAMRVDPVVALRTE
jgi:putative ABC transport system permease protein